MREQNRTRPDIADNLGKLPPAATDLEQDVLGAVILEKNAIIEVAGFLRVEHFYLESHQDIYTAIQQLFAESAPIDLRTVVIRLRELGKLEQIGGAVYVATMVSRVSSAANLEYHARLLVEFAMKREIILLGASMMNESYDETQDVFSILEKGNLLLQEILDNVIASKSDKGMKELAFEVVREQEARQSGKHTGLNSGYKVVDALLNGFQKTDLIIVAARPGMGKTMMAVQALKQIAERGDHVGLISLEMSANQLVERLAIAECEIDGDKVKKGRLDQIEFKRYMDACGSLSKLPIHIDDTPFMTIVELRARAIRMKTKYGIKILAVDYLQLIKGSGKKNQNRDQEIGEITRTLKGIAKELDIPVIALSQLSRAVETRGKAARPQLSDLRESGSIEQDADIVMFLYRPEYYKITEDENGYPTFGLCEVIVAKHRNGSLDTVLLKFLGKFTKFTAWEFGRVDQQPYIERSKDVLPNEDRQRYTVKDVLPKEKNDDLPF